MIHMLSRFNLRSGTTIEKAQAEYALFFENLRAADLAESTGKIGQRVANTPMDTDSVDAQEFYVVMTFRDRAQLDRSYAEIQSGRFAGENAAPHNFIKSAIQNAVFTCWEVR